MFPRLRRLFLSYLEVLSGHILKNQKNIGGKHVLGVFNRLSRRGRIPLGTTPFYYPLFFADPFASHLQW